MTTFTTNPGVNAFETGGPEGLIRIEAGTPYSTTDSREISVLEIAGAHALTKSEGRAAAADKSKADQAPKAGDES